MFQLRRFAGLIFILATLSMTTALAQSSASYKLEESTFNSGGNPTQGVSLSSASFQITLSSIGDPIARAGLSSTSYQLDVGFSFAYPIPGLLDGLRFNTADALTWNPEQSAGSYNLYRGTLTALTGGDYGQCLQQSLVTPGATDAALPASGTGYFYLATVQNRLHEEGGKGFDSSGSNRQGDVCP